MQNIGNPVASVSIYPNPGNGIFTIETLGTNNKSIIEVYNVLGQQVYASEITGSKNEINLSAQKTGVYFYRLLNNNGSAQGSGKIVIQK